MIEFRLGNDLDVDAVIRLYEGTTMGPRRPTSDRARMQQMIQNANVVVTAWHEGRLVGIARSISDFAYCTYLSDLCVAAELQHQGIGRELIQRTRDAAPQAMLILLAAPAAVGYYPKVGFTQHGSAWLLKVGDELR